MTEYDCSLSRILFYTEHCQIVNCFVEMGINNSRIKDIVDTGLFCVHQSLENK